MPTYSIRQHTYSIRTAYVQHTYSIRLAYVPPRPTYSIRQHTYSIRQHTSAYVSIRTAYVQHTYSIRLAYVPPRPAYVPPRPNWPLMCVSIKFTICPKKSGEEERDEDGEEEVEEGDEEPEVAAELLATSRTRSPIVIRLHTSAYVSIRVRMLTYAVRRTRTRSPIVIRLHTSAYVSIRHIHGRQHTSAYVCSVSDSPGSISSVCRRMLPSVYVTSAYANHSQSIRPAASAAAAAVSRPIEGQVRHI
jgi:hypothetical protein